MVSDVDRHVLCFGANALGSATFDPLLIRWSSQESVTGLDSDQSKYVGDLRLSQGSEIVCAIRTTRQIKVFTENSLHSVQFVGAPFVFGQALIGSNVRIAGQTPVLVLTTLYTGWVRKTSIFMMDVSKQYRAALDSMFLTISTGSSHLSFLQAACPATLVLVVLPLCGQRRNRSICYL